MPAAAAARDGRLQGGVDRRRRRSNRRRLERQIQERERIGPVNLVAESELNELEEGRLASQAEREELGVAIHRLRGSIGSLNREGRARLLAAFQDVDRHFRSLFTTLFEGGQAHLELVESDDPLEAGPRDHGPAARQAPRPRSPCSRAASRR